MDMSGFKDQFVKEAKEQLSLLDDTLYKLEKNYDDALIVDVKRCFHTLKGNSAAMGYQNFFELSKALNDLANEFIEKEKAWDRNCLLLFKDGKDKLLYALEYIENDKTEEIDFEGLTEKIKETIN